MSGPTVIVDISGGTGEIRCEPQDHAPSLPLLEHIIERCTTGPLCWNLLLNVPIERKGEFQQRGWTVAGTAANQFGLGKHGVLMRYHVADSGDGRAG